MRKSEQNNVKMKIRTFLLLTKTLVIRLDKVFDSHVSFLPVLSGTCWIRLVG